MVENLGILFTPRLCQGAPSVSHPAHLTRLFLPWSLRVFGFVTSEQEFMVLHHFSSQSIQSRRGYPWNKY